jgi:mRNA guanylyltransferase
MAAEEEASVRDIQTRVLRLVFPGHTTLGEHLYRQLSGPQPKSLARAHLGVLRDHAYWACEKSDGERAMLYISREQRTCFLLDRKFVVTRVADTAACADLWARQGDTLLDGELLRDIDDARPRFATFDVLALDGIATGLLPLSKRLEHIGQGIVLPYRRQAPDVTAAWPLVVMAKAFFPKHHLSALLAHIKPIAGERDAYLYDDGKRRNKNDGLVFTPEDGGYLCKDAAAPLLKWKWPGLNTIDLQVRHPWFDSPATTNSEAMISSLRLYANANAHEGSVVSVHVRSTRLTAEEHAWFLTQVGTRMHAIVEMRYDEVESRWRPKLFRPDKHTPNFLTTVVATLETIIDKVTPTELVQACVPAVR